MPEMRKLTLSEKNSKNISKYHRLKLVPTMLSVIKAPYRKLETCRPMSTRNPIGSCTSCIYNSWVLTLALLDKLRCHTHF